jgi:hypothetical protein
MYKDVEKYYMKALKKDEKHLEAANNPAARYITLRENYEMGLEYLTRATNVKSAQPPL